MFRLLLLAIVLGLSFELSGLAATLGDPPCSANCPDDRSGGECPPNCHSCDCCSSPRTVAAEPTTSAPLGDVRTTESSPLASAPPSVAPSEILHVPKLLA